MKTTLKFFVLAILISSCGRSDQSFDASGTFEAVEIIVSSEASGVIRQLNIQEGSIVTVNQPLGYVDSTQLYLKKKQLLAQIDAILARKPQIATQLASYEVQLESAERELQRLQNLLKADAATPKQVDDAKTQVSVIRRQMVAHRSSLDITSQGLISETLPLSIQVEQLEDQLKKSRIISPVKGTILTQYAEAHELVTPGKPLYKVADVSSIELRAYITGSQLPNIKLNQQVKVSVDNGKGGFREYEGIISWISSQAEFTPKTIQTKDERADLVYAIKARVENDGFLKIGMYGELNLE